MKDLGVTSRFLPAKRNGEDTAAATGIAYLSELSKRHMCNVLCIKDELSAVA